MNSSRKPDEVDHCLFEMKQTTKTLKYYTERLIEILHSSSDRRLEYQDQAESRPKSSVCKTPTPQTEPVRGDLCRCWRTYRE